VFNERVKEELGIIVRVGEFFMEMNTTMKIKLFYLRLINVNIFQEI
jgi:hypothetical protein